MAAAKGNSYASKNRRCGLPTLYRPEYVRRAKLAMRAGFSIVEFAEMIGVTEQTIYQWKQKHEEFALAIEYNKKTADIEIVNSLYHRAKGYTHEAVKIFYDKDAGEVIVPFQQHYPPDTQAAVMWLKNRDPSRWRDKQPDESESRAGDTTVIIQMIMPRPLKGVEEDRNYRDGYPAPGTQVLIAPPAPAEDREEAQDDSIRTS